jgi:hypothetical protein
MSTVARTPDQLNELFLEQLEFLKLSCTSFDNGFVGEIKRLAVSVRVLVHDTKNSTSLLTLTNKKGVVFLDTAHPYNDANQLSHSSLVEFHMRSSGVEVRAHLDSVLQTSLLPFEAWWNGVVLVDSSKNEFSRRDITLYLANKDGGAHVDHQIDEVFDNLRNKNSLGWMSDKGDGREISWEDHVPATMRQIAHEIIKSLDKSYSRNHIASEDAAMIIRNVNLFSGLPSKESPYPNLRKDRPNFGGKKVGRNDLCPCGSGKKYKKCHIFL